ncbi:MAG TPA: hypothetical protein VFP40_16750 [Terriglobales bacterium]|nr:hypothetical protein [Terriglobales bacterium]
MTFLPSRLCPVKLDASTHCGIKRSLLGRRLLRQAAAPLRLILRPTFLRHALGLPYHLLEQVFDPSQALLALDCEMERLTFQGDVWSVQEGDYRSWLTKVTPCKLHYASLAA